jgi:hypothetical protein
MLVKLRRLLSSAFTEECQIVYFLVELRKALELRGLLGNYTALKFYCDWAMHTRLDRAGAEEFLKRLDAVESANSFGIFGDGGPKISVAMDFLKQDLFRRDLCEALGVLDLETEVCTANNLWVAFLDLYASVVADCPLAIKNDSTKTKYVQEAVASKVSSPLPHYLEIDESDPAFAFAVEWRIKLKRPRLGQTEKSWFIFFWRDPPDGA